MTPEEAWIQLEAWTGAAPAFIPQRTAGHTRVLGELVRRHGVSGNLAPDAALAALALEHGLTVWSADSDFARFPEVRWENPVAGAAGS